MTKSISTLLSTTDKKLTMNNKTNPGSALLAVIVISAIATVIFTSASTTLIGQMLQSQTSINSTKSYLLTESGIEEAVLNLLRNQNYSGGTLNLDGNEITISVSGSNPKTITSTTGFGNTKRTIEVVVSYSENNLSIISWKEI